MEVNILSHIIIFSFVVAFCVMLTLFGLPIKFKSNLKTKNVNNTNHFNKVTDISIEIFLYIFVLFGVINQRDFILTVLVAILIISIMRLRNE